MAKKQVITFTVRMEVYLQKGETLDQWLDRCRLSLMEVAGAKSVTYEEWISKTENSFNYFEQVEEEAGL